MVAQADQEEERLWRCFLWSVAVDFGGSGDEGLGFVFGDREGIVMGGQLGVVAGVVVARNVALRGRIKTVRREGKRDD